MSDAKVSIIVPIYNCERYLDRCIKSILDQTYTNIELLLVDDGSNDNSYSICKRFEKFDNRVKVFNQVNSGASAARNVGIANSSGEYLMFVDADDYIENRMLEALINKAISENADYVMCGLTVDVYNSKGSIISSVESNLNPRTILGNINIPSNILDLVENEKISGPCCKLIKTDIIKKNGILMPHHISLQEDLYFNLKVLEHVNIMSVIGGTYYHYNKGLGESVTTRYYHNKYEMTNEVHDLLIEFYISRCKDVSILKKIKFIYIKNTYAAFINLFHNDCMLSIKEKKKYIKKVISSEKYTDMVSGANKIGVKFQLLILILRVKNKTLIYYSSKLFGVMKYSFGFRY